MCIGWPLVSARLGQGKAGVRDHTGSTLLSRAVDQFGEVVWRLREASAWGVCYECAPLYECAPYTNEAETHDDAASASGGFDNGGRDSSADIVYAQFNCTLLFQSQIVNQGSTLLTRVRI